MRGDFSRVTLHPTKNFIQVLKQQGRVDLEADWNEQSDILLHYIQTLARDLIGPHGGPAAAGFALSFSPGDNKLMISRGHYYVDGILCENPSDVSYLEQPYYTPKENTVPDFFLAYLDVWKRHITGYEDNSILEPALGGIDTATRVQAVWQVKLLKLNANNSQERKCADPIFEIENSKAEMRARAQLPKNNRDPCNVEADARYRGADNQLYRVEIHIGNVDEDGKRVAERKPRFKWSREDASVVLPVVSISTSSDSGGTTTVELVNMGRDERSRLRPGDVVEIVDDHRSIYNYSDLPAGGDSGALLKVIDIDDDGLTVTLEGRSKISVENGQKNHPLLRRWDQKAGEGKDYQNGIEIAEQTISDAPNSSDGEWYELEDGVQIQFVKIAAPGATYRVGDYWLIPARTATRDVEWPKNSNGKPAGRPQRGIKHHYAPLGISMINNGKLEIRSCRCIFKSNSRS